eukprot:CAMPEP_0174818464 /NCGR_PEP_ID=MMETSP1107-20130205/1130_1 /TAXON_ID=36770 /ORGANISM="Paraphysomonas vestita, Strain GFlagA" /LENGTH=805 /DNA_ID=CAMNT_0016030309 /DNA_START=244 /DNA_END=2661 /DNA_ORIENTATION=-
MGCFEDKVIKNGVAAELTLAKYRDTKTAGIIERDDVRKLTKIAVPNGPIAAILPTTNPTSTVITKALFSLKTRNGMVFLPHPRASNSTAAAVNVCLEAAVAAGAPEGILQSVDHPNRELSNYVMHHPDIRLLLATGGPGMVKACYESGKPSLGVGSGNASVIIDETANLHEAVGSIVQSKTFDNGVICASEQSVVIVDSQYDNAIQLFKQRGVTFLVGEDLQKLRDYLIIHGSINPDVVGQSAATIASRIGIKVPQGTIVLAGEVTEVGPSEPLSYEKLSPILSFYRASNFEHALDIGKRIVEFGGLGHSSVIYTKKQDRLDQFGLTMPAFHLMANMPTALGAIGTSFNFNVDPSLTLGVGTIGGSSLSGSLTPMHLLDIKTLADKEEHMQWFKIPPKIYYNRNCMEDAFNDLKEDKDLHRAIIITDRPMVDLGYVRRVTNALEERGFLVHVFDAINPDPDMSCVRAGVRVCESFKPDVMICLGGGSPMDAGKFIRVQYENPSILLDDLSARFIELRLRTQHFPDSGSKIKKLVCIPTTSGTASEVTPFSVITDDDNHKLPLFSYKLTPDMAIIDSSFTDNLPKSLIANAGVDAITHAVEAYTSVAANDFTAPYALRACKLLFDNLTTSYNLGTHESREKVHHGASIAGLAFSNSFLGVCHSLSHKVGSRFHLPHGLCNAILLPHVMLYNSSLNPTRMGIYPTYNTPKALSQYASIAKHIGLSGNNDIELTQALVDQFQTLCKDLNMPISFHDAGINEQKFISELRNIAEESFDDQCTPSNPRFPIAKELEEVLRNAYYGATIKF